MHTKTITLILKCLQHCLVAANSETLRTFIYLIVLLKQNQFRLKILLSSLHSHVVFLQRLNFNAITIFVKAC